MSKTTPVRWWRSDEDRYKSRGAYTSPEPPAAPRWAIELLAGPPDPELAAAFAYLDSLPKLEQALGIPMDLWDPPAKVDPIAEVKAELRLLASASTPRG